MVSSDSLMLSLLISLKKKQSFALHLWINNSFKIKNDIEKSWVLKKSMVLSDCHLRMIFFLSMIYQTLSVQEIIGVYI